MARKRTLILILLMSTIVLPLILMNTMNVSASWLGHSQPLTNPGNTLDYSEPSICFDENGTMYYIYTQHVYEDNDHEIYIGNNTIGKELTEGGIYDLDDTCLTEGAGAAITNMSNCNYGDVAFSNGTLHIAWQGVPYGEIRSQIGYTYSNTTNGKPNDNIIRLSASTNNATNPSIVSVNGYVFVAFYDESVNDVRLCTNWGGNLLTNRNDPDGTRQALAYTSPKLSAWSSDTYWRVDLSYIENTTGDIVYTYLESTDADLTPLASRDVVIAGPISELDMDSSPNMAAFCYVDTVNDIWVANSSDVANPKRVENNAIVEGDPDVIINDNNIITAFFVRNYTTDNSQIISVDNYGTNQFDNQDHLIGIDQIPYSGSGSITGLRISGFDAELIQGEQVVILYEATEKVDAGAYKDQTLYLSAYGNFYNDGDGDYNQYSWEETLGESVYSVASIIEGIQISYNTSSGNDVPIKIKLTDTITNETWENTTTLSGSGGYNEKFRFFSSAGSYFIAKNPFTVQILNGSTMDDLVKIEVDPLLFANITANATSDYENGTIPYTIHYENTDLHFTIFLFDYLDAPKRDVLTRTDTLAVSSSTYTLNSNNYVDLFKFNMMGGEKYNMSLRTIGASDNSCRLMIFNNSQQITDPSKAIYTMFVNSTTNGTYIPLYTATSKTFYVVIENLAYAESYTYTFHYRVCPMIAKLISPSSGQYINDNFFNFQWAVNDAEGGLTISSYDFLTFADDDLVNPIVKLYGITTTSQIVEIIGVTGGHSYPSYSHLNGKHYLNVTVHSADGQSSEPSTHVFNIDTVNPDAPVLSMGIGYYSEGDYWVNWTVPSDGPDFLVSHYELYRGYTSDFICGPSTRLGVDVYSNTTYEYGLESDVYYYKVIAVDQVGLKSNPSNWARYVVSLTGFVDPKNQNFNILAGDFLEYQIVDIYDGGNHDPNTMFTTFMGRSFQINTLLHFYISSVSADEVIPVEGKMYRKWMNTTSLQQNAQFELLGSGVDLFPLVATSNKTYQGQLYDLFMARQYEIDLSTIRTEFEYNARESWYFNTFQAVEVIVHTYTKDINYDQEEIGNINFLYDSAIFVVDKNTGVLIEMTLYDYDKELGFSLKLIGTNIGLTNFDWWWLPFLIIGSLGIIAALINQVVKKLERRV